MKTLTRTFVLLIILLAHYHTQASDWTGALAPNFELKDQQGKTHQLADYKGQWLVVYFYPKDQTPGCTTEAKNFRDSLAQYEKLKTKIVGVSVDSVSSHSEFAQIHELNFPILADTEKKMSKAYKVLMSIGPLNFAKRESFVIDPLGNIVKHYGDVDADSHWQQILSDLPELQKI